jgi:hypothetical protein
VNTVGLYLFVQNTFMFQELVTITTFYVTHYEFQFDRHLLVLYANNDGFLYASKYTRSYFSVFFWYDTVRIEFTTLRLTNIKFLFQILMYFLMIIYCSRFGIKIILCTDI